ncbi:type IV toxin-antitoxin system AbiEi family antitoxin [Rhodocytophaga aerolata]|uniref:Type IV toxin-antitoxin system AbiEi family antitoxin n=1 Tax=Rhodocytophaga aerolata TaxID=455078 RepID=A0ABT8RFR5_9BACT|nr:type IV toxin-antitoxin system AbiEi family antitoxin [Rhodocytophaga aerolata]MDO1449635.1 type IV toxin-antitoxin system AbiEi family antitoxin [Rhodocytophaga aerolata]
MSTENVSKINHLMQSQPHGIVFLSSWLSKKGYSLDLQKRYKKSQWLEPIGTGAMKRRGDKVQIEGAIFALQQQLNMSVHIGGKSALAMLGKLHYLEFNKKEVILFGQAHEKLPKWFLDYHWEQKVKYHPSNFLPQHLNIIAFEVRNFSINISGPIRALMECLYLAPKEQSLVECYDFMEGLNNLSPATVQAILEQCNSIKVKRLFLFMAEKARHSWFKYIKYDNIDLGKGKRSVVPNGVYLPQYEITVPRELVNHKSGI